MRPATPSCFGLLLLPTLVLACTSAAAPDDVMRQIPAPGEARAVLASDTGVQSIAAEIDAYLSSVYDPADPGAAVLVTRGGEIILREAYGMADLELGVEMRPEHVFGIGSITKQFTAVAILTLVEEGLISLDDEIVELLPDYPSIGHRITVEHLLHHTSGIPNNTILPETQRRIREDLDLEEVVAMFSNEPLEFAPGEDWRYSNSGYVLLGRIIEEVSGQAYADLLRDRIFEPAGMTSSYYGTDSHIIPGRVEGYLTVGGGWRNAEYISMTQPHAAGALLSTVDDLARWYRALDSGNLVDPALLELAFTPHRLPDGRSTGYGYGWLAGRAFDRATLEHGGGMEGFLGHVLRIPSEDMFIAVLTNREADPSPGQVALRIGARALGETFEPQAVSLPLAVLEDYIGVYRVNAYERREVTLEEGRLHSLRTGGQKLELVPVGDDAFVYTDTHTRAEFTRDESGAVLTMRTRPRAGLETVATRIDGALDPEPRELPLSALDRYTGEYQFAPDVTITVTRVGGELRVLMTGLPEVTLQAESETRFKAVGVPAWIDFEVAGDRPAQSALVFLDGRETRAPRIR